ncbi:MAG: hypothetical protein IPP88_02565 [Betaproteobacteria bacterium]|nr:hypothetical protein [Betaproteobacteria bacterium]
MNHVTLFPDDNRSGAIAWCFCSYIETRSPTQIEQSGQRVVVAIADRVQQRIHEGYRDVVLGFGMNGTKTGRRLKDAPGLLERVKVKSILGGSHDYTGPF